MLKEILLYGTIITSAVGCCCKQAYLTPNEQSRLEILSEFNDLYFEDLTQECLSQSPINVYKIKAPVNGFYTLFTKERGLSKEVFDKGDVEDTLFHESMHRLIACGLLDLHRFMELYTKLNPNLYPIKKRVEERINFPSIKHIDEHRLVFLAEYLMMSTAYDLPSELQEFFEPVLNFKERKNFIRGLVGRTIK